MPQPQQYPTNDQRLHQVSSTSLPTSVSCDTAPRRIQPNQSTWFNPTDTTTKLQAALYLDAPRQRYQSGQPDCRYQQKEEKKVYQIENDAPEQQSGGFHTTFESAEEELAYSDESFDKVFVNFVEIEAVCSKCRSLFPSKSKLHTQIKFYDTASVPPSSHPFSNLGARPALLLIDASMKIVLENGIRVFGDTNAVRLISDLVAEYLSIWESWGLVQIPPERWMKVSLKPGWEVKVSAIKPRVYPLDNDAQWLVDDTFNKLHQQGHMKFTSDLTPFSFPVFVVWESDSEGKKKGRAAVDIRKLNDLVLPNFYPLPLQSKIVANVQDCTNLAVLDAASFFYQ